MKNDLTQEMVDEADRLLNESKLPNKDILFNKDTFAKQFKEKFGTFEQFQHQGMKDEKKAANDLVSLTLGHIVENAFEFKMSEIRSSFLEINKFTHLPNKTLDSVVYYFNHQQKKARALMSEKSISIFPDFQKEGCYFFDFNSRVLTWNDQPVSQGEHDRFNLIFKMFQTCLNERRVEVKLIYKKN